MIAEVAVEKTQFAFDKLFSYIIPEHLVGCIPVGACVGVPFGPRNSIRRAFVINLKEQNPESNLVLKKIDSLIDSSPILSPEQIKLASWVSKYYLCSLYDSLSLILPKYVKNNEFEKKQNNFLPLEINLSDYQNNIYTEILNWFFSSEKKESLLYGITGSGKTQVFLKLAQKLFLKDKKILILVPEISLIPQMAKIIEKFFGKDSFACLHSGLSNKVRSSEWNKIKNGAVNIVLGTRSAIFAPMIPDLIVIDEEQEPTYKSDKTPRYNAKEVARFLCKNYNCKLILSSATPSVESFYLTKSRKISLFQLKKRHGNSKLPEVKIVNINKNLYSAKSILSLDLLDELKDRISKGEQSILLLDRRGFHTLARCSYCGSSISCENCSTTLVHHLIDNKNKLICHYCGFNINVPKICPKCKNHKINLIGVGTQSLENEIRAAIPESKCLRVDADTTKSKKVYEKMFDDFKSGKYNIMVGTRMVAKGLDFDNVSLVGILCADQSLFGEGYKSYERTFSLISQAVGRSGRKNNNGKALIQSFSADNPIIEISAKQNYDVFFEKEIKLRKLMLYPPFADLCTIGFVGINEEKTWQSCLFFFESLKYNAKIKFNDIPIKILFPSKAFVTKLSKKFRFRITIKCRNSQKFRKFLTDSLIYYQQNSEINKFKINPRNKNGIHIFFDMNPEHLF